MKEMDKKLRDTIDRYTTSGIEQQVDYDKFYLYSLITHSTAIEGSTITEVENQLLFDEGIAAKGRSLTEQMMNVDLKNAYLFGFEWTKAPAPYTVDFLCELSARVMRCTGSEYSALGGTFDSSKGELRRCNVSAGVGGKSYLAFQKVPEATADFCAWLNQAMAFIPSIVTKEAKGEYIQALIDSRENENSVIIQEVMMAQHIANLESRILQYQKTMNDTVNDTESDTVKSNDITSRLIAVIKKYPEYTYDKYAQVLGVGRATVARHIKKLNGTVIYRIGSDKDGYWEFMAGVVN